MDTLLYYYRRRDDTAAAACADAGEQRYSFRARLSCCSLLQARPAAIMSRQASTARGAVRPAFIPYAHDILYFDEVPTLESAQPFYYYKRRQLSQLKYFG